ncbi:hypothetical protein J2X46_002454 [Nocardioides sp. BE266]|uniref:DUF6973 domain-containing protein n=1 Tax=Nocardioides sp. BE266 TaxID=2817725 RepID=UPI0028611406|nr:hypothetical protein [Nocardioides sp. BE266]MDR7253464.1 hypothetical protein [Nocardioides sp. BE266]
MGFLDQAIHAATGVPRLYTAALKAGVGPAGAFEVLRISQSALTTAAAQGRGVPGRTNAMRHFMWQALLTARFGRPVAASIARAQEQGSPDGRDSRVDQHNNAVGQDHGEAHAEELKTLSIADALTMLVPVALEKWESDELIWVKPH